MLVVDVNCHYFVQAFSLLHQHLHQLGMNLIRQAKTNPMQQKIQWSDCGICCWTVIICQWTHAEHDSLQVYLFDNICNLMGSLRSHGHDFFVKPCPCFIQRVTSVNTSRIPKLATSFPLFVASAQRWEKKKCYCKCVHLFCQSTLSCCWLNDDDDDDDDDCCVVSWSDWSCVNITTQQSLRLAC